MWHDIIIALWFFVPAGVANVAPVLAAKVPWLERFKAPIDGGRSIGGKRILGDNKTWRGIVAGIVLATFTLALQWLIVRSFPSFAALLRPLEYVSLSILALGPLFAIGALGGDAIESFAKRRLAIQPGSSWVPFDQIDYIIGAIIVTMPFVRLSWLQYMFALVLWVVLHFATAYIGYLLHFKKTPI